MPSLGAESSLRNRTISDFPPGPSQDLALRKKSASRCLLAQRLGKENTSVLPIKEPAVSPSICVRSQSEKALWNPWYRCLLERRRQTDGSKA